jgi:glycosyltransferase involved in cell wall biosynthesis
MLRPNLASLSLSVSDTSTKKPIVIHHHNNLTMGGTEKMCQIFLKHFIKDNTFDHYVAYKADGDNTREPYFKEIVGPEKMICYESPAKLLSTIHGLKPFILHRYSAGIPEYPFVREIKQHTKHFVSTSVFGNQDDTIEISKVIYVSKHVQHMAGKTGIPEKGIYYPDHSVVRNPIEAPYSTEDLREELGIPKDAFVFGRIGRDDESIYDPINIKAYAEVATSNTYFVFVNPSGSSRADIKRLGITSARYIERTTSEIRLSQFYNTIDVLAHSRKDGECNPANVFEAAAHRKPVISHYGQVFNGHMETIQDSGFVVLSNDVDEYARIMKAFIEGVVDYETLSQNAYSQWCKVKPELMSNKQLNIYKSLP